MTKLPKEIKRNIIKQLVLNYIPWSIIDYFRFLFYKIPVSSKEITSKIINYLLRYKNLQEELNQLSKNLNLTINLPHLNKSNHNHYSTYYTEETKEIIGNIYKTDIELFGYTFENKII